MKKTRKQTALAKCVLATIMAMGMMGYTTVWAEDTVTPTPSPIDKTVSKDAAGHIYEASYNHGRGYFWTDLGHAQVQIGSGKQIELFTPFIYHTNNGQWEKDGDGWNPVHEGDNSEMQCEESMSNITVGEFDRIIKSLYTNDITMAKTIYGEEGQAGLQDKLIKEVRATAGQGAIVNTYTLVRENGTEVETSIVDTNTITTVANDENGYVTVSGGMGEDGNYNYTVGFNEGKLIQTINNNDKNTITTVHHDNSGYITVDDTPDDKGNHNYTVAFD